MTLRSQDNSRSDSRRPLYWQSLVQLQLPGSGAREPGESLLGESCDGVVRRNFLRLMAASLGLAGVNFAGCRRWPQSQIVPHNAQTPGTAPGRRQQYASCIELGGVATGVMVTAVDGRPIKIEGNPMHPFSLGAADAWTQASILEMYDPDRSRRVTEAITKADGGRELVPRSWAEFFAFAHKHLDEARRVDGKGLAVLLGLTSSPTMLRLAQDFQIAFPQSRWFTFEPVSRDAEIEGIRSAIGQAARPMWDFEKARIVAVFSADLFGTHAGRQRWARQWSRLRTGEDGMFNRWYVAEAAPTVTGSVADHRLPIAPSRIESLLDTLATKLGVSSGPPRHDPVALSAAETRWLDSLHADLTSHPETSLIVVGSELHPRLHAMAAALNQALGNVGKTLTYIQEPHAVQGPCAAHIRELSQAITSGAVNTLFILGGNPVYDAPADCPLDLSNPVLKSIHCGLHFNETSAKCTWHAPLAHWLETWGDGRAWDGTYSVRQPLILPLFDGKSEIEMVATFLRRGVTEGRELVRETCKQQRLLAAGSDVDFERAWEVLLHDGVLKSSAFVAENLSLRERSPATVDASDQAKSADDSLRDDQMLEAVFRLDSSVHDGRYANNGWLQELPDPIAKSTWDNGAWISPQDAARLRLAQGDIVRLSNHVNGLRQCEAAVYVMPGQAAGTIGLSLGYGRSLAGQIGNGVGFNVYGIKTADSLERPARVQIERVGRRHSFALTQDHYAIDAVGDWGRRERIGKLHESGSLVREATWGAYSKDPEAVKVHQHGPAELELFDPPSRFAEPHAWGMSIDLSKCIGCSACVVACQAENNIPIVGKDQVARNREMHWLRIDTYFKGAAEQPDFVHMPMTCQHCETAPCEQVCPVAATVHDSEGLNTMVYNRCIGTRYCSNNCPAKVRRFNFFDFHATSPNEVRKPWLAIPDTQPSEDIDPLRRMQFNPEVTVRMRGVMEKCTFCTQRIQAAKISARVAHAQGHRDTPLVKDGEVTPACAAACPTAAIRFGDLNDRGSAVAQAHADPRAYQFLEELQLRPRTRYLAKLRNPVAGLPGAGPSPEGS